MFGLGGIFQALFIGGTIGLLLVIAVFAIVPAAAIFYILESTIRTHIPTGIMIARWGAKGRTYIPLIIMEIILAILLILCVIGIIVTLSSDSAYFTAIPVILFVIIAAIAIIPTFILLFGTLAWITRIIIWIFRLWSALIYRLIGEPLESIKIWLVIHYLRLLILIEKSPQKQATACTKTFSTTGTQKQQVGTSTATRAVTPGVKPVSTTIKKPAQPVAQPIQKEQPLKKDLKSRFTVFLRSGLEAIRFGSRQNIPSKPLKGNSVSSVPANSCNHGSTASNAVKSSNGPTTTKVIYKEPIRATKPQPPVQPPIIKESKTDLPIRPATIKPAPTLSAQVATPTSASSQPTDITPEVKMSWQDKQLLKLMTSPTIIKIMSNRSIVAVLTKMTMVYTSVSTRFSRKNKNKINLNIK